MTYKQYKSLLKELGISYNYQLICGLSGGMINQEFMDSVADNNPLCFKDKRNKKVTVSDLVNTGLL